jgi:hypothetical protein
MGGLPTTVFARTRVSRVIGPTTMPFVLPVTRFSSMTLPDAAPIRPIPKSFGGSEWPLLLVSFSRTRLL